MIWPARHVSCLAGVLAAAAVWAVVMVPLACSAGVIDHGCACHADRSVCCEAHRVGCDDLCDHADLQAPRGEETALDAAGAEAPGPALAVLPSLTVLAPEACPDPPPWPGEPDPVASPAATRNLPLLA